MIKKATITLVILISLWAVAHVLAQGGGALPSNLYTTPPSYPGNINVTWTGTQTFGTQIISTVTTGTAPFSITSTTPVTTLVVANHPQVQACGTTSTCSHTSLTSGQIVVGSAPLVSGTPSTVTISGISPAFTSATSYQCSATDATTAANNLLKVANVSGSSFTITGPATLTDVMSYVCAGN